MIILMFLVGILMGSFFVVIGLKKSLKEIKEIFNYKYFTVMIITGVMYAMIYHKFSGFDWNFFLGIWFISIMMIVIVSDLEYMLIYNGTLFTGGIVIAIMKFANNSLEDNLNGLLTMIFVTILFILLYYIFKRIYNIEAIGGGDIKLYMVISLMFNFNLTILSLFIASLLGIIFNFNNKSLFAFGPYIVCGSMISYFYGDIILRIVFQI